MCLMMYQSWIPIYLRDFHSFFKRKIASFWEAAVELQIDFPQMLRETPLGNVLKMLLSDFHWDPTTITVFDDVPKLDPYLPTGFPFIFQRKIASFWEAAVEPQIDFSQIFRKTPLGNVLKMLQTNFHWAPTTGNMLGDVP